jgi:predicted tellurium resistance membrane protein TerC
MWDFSIFAQADAWMALITLTMMEIVLGIDNIVFISIMTDKLPRAQQPKARSIGLSLALFSRLALLFAISWVMSLVEPLFEVRGHTFSGRDLILLAGGLFLMAKATSEVFEKLELADEDDGTVAPARSLVLIVFEIMLLDIVFSLDSVITAVGMAQDLLVMVVAMVIAVGIMLVFAGTISDFINKRPSMKMLALSFLLLIGVMLVAEGVGQHIDKGYIYFAMGFSFFVEMVNLRTRKNLKPVELHSHPRAPSSHGLT